MYIKWIISEKLTRESSESESEDSDPLYSKVKKNHQLPPLGILGNHQDLREKNINQNLNKVTKSGLENQGFVGQYLLLLSLY